MKNSILVIDDHQDLLILLKDILEEDYLVHLATNAEQAKKLLDEQVIHLIISDVMMPGMDGFQLCRLIKSDVAYCHIPIILLTSMNGIRAHIEGLEHGADAYIPKPFSEELLKIQVASLLLNRTKIKDHFASVPFEDVRVMAHSKADEIFLQKLDEYIRKNLKNPNIDMVSLADHMFMSRPTFYRKVKALSSLTPKELIDITRLKKAASLIAENRYTLYEVSVMVGYSSQSLFSRNFFKYYKMNALEYAGSLPKAIRDE
ncbi:response regulator [Pedobacter petrophilus]|uniref:Response regulator n=2 Tax=Pedobacter TaxID=84567 RepID=A0A7K0G3M1_9SPHI|nr:response regulator [Pedobacter petrophilus]MRX78311.1 response regulator [Pedobacter petrophilus]